MRALIFLAVWVLVHVRPLSADIDLSAYETVGAVRDEQEQQYLQTQFAAEAERERLRAEAEARSLEQANAETLAQALAKPYPERLTEQQCTLCHPAENYRARRHTWLYWRLTVARMVWLNGAPVAPDAQGVIAGYLAGAYPALPEQRLFEYGLPAFGLMVLAAAIGMVRRLWKPVRRKKAMGQGFVSVVSPGPASPRG